VLVARQAADVDLLSRGRLRLGVGLGWNYVEYDALGQDFHTRGKRMDEQVGLLRKLWSEPLVSFEGEFDRIDRAALVPRPARQIPIWMGGFADVALRRGAKLADGFIFVQGAEDVLAMAERLKGFLKEAGREEKGFGLHCNMLRSKTPEAVVEMAKRWRDAGGSHVSVNTMGMGFTTTEQHTDYIKKVADTLRKERLL
jgi:alkanesulfonate monooxygenase SsuD/methylene tetrahydromethanopterin reductase-like flavin-dependent oxidoreductase (luciferase family)